MPAGRDSSKQSLSTRPLSSGRLYAIVIHINDPTKSAAMSTTVLSVRVSPEERAILEAASEQAHTSLSEFLRRKAVDAAECDMLERRVVTIPTEDWEAFES